MSLDEAARQLELAAHDTQVAFDCIGLGEIERAHTHTITARAAADAAEVALRIALAELTPEEAERAGEKAMERIVKEEESTRR
jgi:predicted kinase